MSTTSLQGKERDDAFERAIATTHEASPSRIEMGEGALALDNFDLDRKHAPIRISHYTG